MVDQFGTHYRYLPDGRKLDLQPILFGGARVGISGDPRSGMYEDEW